MPADLWNPALFVQTGDPSTVDELTPFAIGQLGMVLVVKGNTTVFSPGISPRIYQFVKLKSDATAAKGAYVIWSDMDNFEVTTVNSTVSAQRNVGAGFLQGTKPTAGSYGFIQVGGQGTVLIENGSTPAVGQQIIAGATTAGRADTVALGTAPTGGPYGVILTLKNAGSIGTDNVEALICPVFRLGW